MPFIENFVKILLYFLMPLLLILPIIHAVNIYIDAPVIPDFEQFRAEYTPKKNAESFQWIEFEDMPPAVPLYSALYKVDTGLINHWLDILKSAHCYGGIRDDKIYAKKVATLLKDFYQLPIAIGTPTTSARGSITTDYALGCSFAMELKYEWSKEHILEAYLNTVSYGHQIYGIHAASQFFLNKLPDELTVQETILLITISKYPNHYLSNQERLFQLSCYQLEQLAIPNKDKDCQTLQPIINDMINKPGFQEHLTLLQECERHLGRPEKCK